MPDTDNTSVIETPFDAALSERYLVYALSMITARSLPDVTAALKPVHRRLVGDAAAAARSGSAPTRNARASSAT